MAPNEKAEPPGKPGDGYHSPKIWPGFPGRLQQGLGGAGNPQSGHRSLSTCVTATECSLALLTRSRYAQQTSPTASNTSLSAPALAQTVGGTHWAVVADTNG